VETFPTSVPRESSTEPSQEKPHPAQSQPDQAPLAAAAAKNDKLITPLLSLSCFTTSKEGKTGFDCCSRLDRSKYEYDSSVDLNNQGHHRQKKAEDGGVR